MSELLKVLEKQESPRMTDSEYLDFLKKQKIENIKEFIKTVLGVLLLLIIFTTAAIF